MGINLLLKAVYILEKLQDFILSDQYTSRIVRWLIDENKNVEKNTSAIKLLEFTAKACLILFSILSQNFNVFLTNCLIHFLFTTCRLCLMWVSYDWVRRYVRHMPL